MSLRIFKNKEIDRLKWDETILSKGVGRMYFLSAYLDAVCYDWDALIYGDYEVVMPIPHSIFMLFVRRYDIPLFIQQLGIIGLKENQGDLKNEFIQKSQNLFRGYFCSFCFENDVQEIKGLKSNIRTNFELDLNQSYDDLRNGYSSNLTRNLKKADDAGLKFKMDTDFEILESFILNHSKPDDPSPRKIEMIKSIYSINHPFFESDIYSVWKADEPLAVCLAPRFQDRITLLIPRSNDEGLSMNAMAFLIDQIIQRNTGSNVVLDFEGSMLPGVAQFYSGFGALDRKYSILQRS